MRNLTIIIVLIVVVGWSASSIGNAFSLKGDFERRVDHFLDMVDDNSIEQVKTDLLSEARKFGVALEPKNIRVNCRDTDERTFAQGFVPATYINKRVDIRLRYGLPLLGFHWEQQYATGKIIQLKAIAPSPGLP